VKIKNKATAAGLKRLGKSSHLEKKRKGAQGLLSPWLGRGTLVPGQNKKVDQSQYRVGL